MLIAMFLSPGTVEPENQLYPGQGTVQLLLLGIAAVCVPWLLCLKPFLEWREIRRVKAQGYVGLHDGEGGGLGEEDRILEGEEEGSTRNGENGAVDEGEEAESVCSF